jgi:hypothetical protein
MLQIKVGDKFGWLTVIGLIPDSKNPKAKCLCECGSVTITQRGSLKIGRAKSCGCKKAALQAQKVKTHGMSKTKEYKAFRGIIYRCKNKNAKEYKNYGGRGIEVLYKNFEEFLDDVGYAPVGGWIDRIDNNGHYAVGNCKWSTPTEQQKNKRPCKFWVINGVSFESSTDAASALGVDRSLVSRNCNGYKRNGKVYLPKEKWSCFYKYKQENELGSVRAKT